MAYNSDNEQNELFKNMLRFSFTKKFNIHLNLGVYFNKQGKVIFNTQLANFYINIPKRMGKSINEHYFLVGQKLGKEIAEILMNHYNINNFNNNITLLKTQIFLMTNLIKKLTLYFCICFQQ